MIKQTKNPIPEEELMFEFARSGGPGGQKVNKTETKVTVRWNVDKSKAFDDVQKARIRDLLHHRINKHGELMLSSEEERSQIRNRQIVIERLNEMVGGAIIPPKVRKPTKPSRAAREKRLEGKKRVSQKKASRKRPDITE